MSIFVKLATNDLKEMRENNKFAKNAMLNLKDSTFSVQNELKVKHELILKARNLVNSAHEELVHLVDLMPQIEPLTSLNVKSVRTTTFDMDTDLLSLKSHTIRDNSKDKHKVLKRLGERISELK
jgi:hypothetical protein